MEEPSENLPLISENWERHYIKLEDYKKLENYLKIKDQTNFLEYMKNIQEEIPPRLAENLLTMSAQHNFQYAIKAILERFETPYLNINLREHARAAIQNGRHVIFEVLLKAAPELAHDLILSICLKLVEPKKRGIDGTSNLKKCLELILEEINVNVSFIDNISLILSNYFDACVKKKNHEDTNEDIFDYRCLMSHNIFAKQDTTQRAKCETEVLLDIARNEKLNNLLKHQLLSSFLCEKWSKIRRVLHANIFFYVIFFLFNTAYILTYESSPNENGTQIVNNSFDVTLNSTLLIRHYPSESLLRFFVIVLRLLLPIREILLFACGPCRYWMNTWDSWENWLQVVLIIFTLILLCGVGLWSHVAVILLSALMLTTLFSQYWEKMSASFERFRIVFLNCICLLILYIFPIVAFASVFYILFKNNKNFSDPVSLFVKTLIMITGEFNSNDIPYDSHPVLSYIVFVPFVFFTIVFLFEVNRDENVSKAELNGLIPRIRLIVYLEGLRASFNLIKTFLRKALGKLFSWFSCENLRFLRWNNFSFLINISYFLRNSWWKIALFGYTHLTKLQLLNLIVLILVYLMAKLTLFEQHKVAQYISNIYENVTGVSGHIEKFKQCMET